MAFCALPKCACCLLFFRLYDMGNGVYLPLSFVCLCGWVRCCSSLSSECKSRNDDRERLLPIGPCCCCCASSEFSCLV
ncbi:MAG: hypothetical protein J3R72DRAFT_430704 [Linnemannia gamsii]|nr:MAG: hypothetical protein J3R72DRAFT_430704 [Linnemannia gamsii]